MILLDTNYLIKALVPESKESLEVRKWLEQKSELITTSISWYEFLCGPVDENGENLMELILQGRIVPFTTDCAREAARLFNAVNRKRSLRVDAMIAASAIVFNAELATDNMRDFSAFSKYGLTLL